MIDEFVGTRTRRSTRQDSMTSGRPPRRNTRYENTGVSMERFWSRVCIEQLLGNARHGELDEIQGEKMTAVQCGYLKEVCASLVVTGECKSAFLLTTECLHEGWVVFILGSGFVGRSFLALGNVASGR